MSGSFKLSLDLAMRPGETHAQHVDRVAHMHQLPGRVQPRHQDAVEQPGADKLTPAELAALERSSEEKGAAALRLLRPKKKTKGTL